MKTKIYSKPTTHFLTFLILIVFGAPNDVPAPVAYDGDGKKDAAVYRNSIWYLRQSANGFSAVPFGLATDKPIPTTYLLK